MFFPVFPLVFGAFAALLFGGLQPLLDHGQPRWALLLASLLPGLPVLAVLYRWATTSGGVRDFYQGGVLEVTRDDPEVFAWSDWAVVFTRTGKIFRRSRGLRLERRALLGLIPLGVVERPLADFYRLEVTAELQETSRRRRSFGLVSSYERERVPVCTDYGFHAVDRRADRLLLLDVSVSVHDGRGERFVGVMRERLDELIGTPGTVRMDGPPRPDQVERREERREAPPPADDFEAWRARRRTS